MVQYVWIGNPAYYDPSCFKSGAPIPAEHLNNISALAAQNDSWSIGIWCDGRTLSAKDKAFIEKGAWPRNIGFKDLMDVPSYKKDPLFHAKVQKPSLIWKQADLARLLVLEHVLEHPNADAAVYCDMDIVNLDLNAPVIQSSMDKYGVLFASFDHDGQSGSFVENSLLGFSRREKKFLSDKLIPETRESYKNWENNGWIALCGGVEQFWVERGLTVPKEWPHFLTRTMWNGKRPHFDPDRTLDAYPSVRDSGPSRAGSFFLKRLLPNRQKVFG